MTRDTRQLMNRLQGKPVDPEAAKEENKAINAVFRGRGGTVITANAGGGERSGASKFISALVRGDVQVKPQAIEVSPGMSKYLAGLSDKDFAEVVRESRMMPAVQQEMRRRKA